MGAITIRSNIASLKAQRQIASSNRELSLNYERLSSGLRINRASDDAAGDVDVASESAKLVANVIREQVGAAVLSQANQLPQLVLGLLKFD